VRLTRDETSWQRLSTAPNPKSGLLRTALDWLVNYPQSHLALAGISGSLPLEVLINIAARHEFARDSAHRVNNGSLALRRGSRAQVRIFYKISER
jgi:hypothetical protein